MVCIIPTSVRTSIKKKGTSVQDKIKVIFSSVEFIEVITVKKKLIFTTQEDSSRPEYVVTTRMKLNRRTTLTEEADQLTRRIFRTFDLLSLSKVRPLPRLQKFENLCVFFLSCDDCETFDFGTYSGSEPTSSDFF